MTRVRPLVWTVRHSDGALSRRYGSPLNVDVRVDVMTIAQVWLGRGFGPEIAVTCAEPEQLPPVVSQNWCGCACVLSLYRGSSGGLSSLETKAPLLV